MKHDIVVDKDRVACLMGELGVRGVRLGRQPWTTKADKDNGRAPDLVKRRCAADRPNQLWVSDFTCVSTWSGFVDVASILDVYSRMIVGGRVAPIQVDPIHRPSRRDWGVAIDRDRR